jgi:hypothetical protein
MLFAELQSEASSSHLLSNLLSSELLSDSDILVCNHYTNKSQTKLLRPRNLMSNVISRWCSHLYIAAHMYRMRCDRALKLAEKWLRVPLVLNGEHLASPELDEQSTLTYLSYFMAVNSPGYKATLRWVQRQISPVHVLNFYVSMLD